MTRHNHAGLFKPGHKGAKPRQHNIPLADLTRALIDGGSVSGAARLLGVSRMTVKRRILESKRPRPESEA